LVVQLLKSAATFFQRLWGWRAEEKLMQPYIGKVDVFGYYRNFLFPVFFQQQSAPRLGESIRRYATRVTMATGLISACVLISWHPDANPSDSSGGTGASCRRHPAWYPENNSVRFSDDWEIRKNGHPPKNQLRISSKKSKF